jgi:hypothetical protein
VTSEHRRLVGSSQPAKTNILADTLNERSITLIVFTQMLPYVSRSPKLLGVMMQINGSVALTDKKTYQAVTNFKHPALDFFLCNGYRSANAFNDCYVAIRAVSV